MLLAKHGIQMSEATVAHQCITLGLKGNWKTTAETPAVEAILFDTGTMLISIGPHKIWSKDGHDKLIPNNCLKNIIAYLYLSLIKEMGVGMPIQTTMDYGSETTEVYGLANALCEAFLPDLPVDEVPAHRFLRSVHNVTMEQGWLNLCLQWGDNVVTVWQQGEVHHDKKKMLSLGVSPNVAMATYKEYGATYCLQEVDIGIVCALKQELGGEALIQFVSLEFVAHCQAIYNTFGI
ncbi:hypothetical protein K439DRAFT_1646069 [Ramaria rubella]|nr:hypothetical protein K439DRAFT_1646069 [Ramaria rubella]